jgi:hypothetical protein
MGETTNLKKLNMRMIYTNLFDPLTMIVGG